MMTLETKPLTGTLDAKLHVLQFVVTFIPRRKTKRSQLTYLKVFPFS